MKKLLGGIRDHDHMRHRPDDEDGHKGMKAGSLGGITRMSTRTFRFLVLGVLCISAIVYAPFHYSWRWRQNEVQHEQGRIIKDDWAADQAFIPIEAWGLGALGVGGALFATWQLTRGRRHPTQHLRE